MSMPKAPPIITRAVVLKILEPAVRALSTPVRTRPTSVKPTILKASVPTDGARAPAKGISPPAVNEIADAIAACTGRAFVWGC